jgi:hypothetical protein
MFRKNGSFGLGVFCFLFLWAAFFLGPMQSYGDDNIIIEIEVAPKTLNIENEGQWITVHTDIAYGAVVGASVSLNEIPISWSKSDNQGNFVAKFVMDEVKALADAGFLTVGGENLLILEGYMQEGTKFIGSTTITVIDGEPAGPKGK